MTHDERIDAAISEIQSGQTTSRAARRYGLARTNLQTQIDEAGDQGHPFTKPELRNLVDEVMDQKGLPHVSEGWWSSWWNSQQDLFQEEFLLRVKARACELGIQLEDVVPLLNEAHLRTATPMQIAAGWSIYSFEVAPALVPMSAAMSILDVDSSQIPYREASESIRISKKTGLELTSTRVRNNIQAIKINRRRIRPIQPNTLILQQNNQQNQLIINTTCLDEAPKAKVVSTQQKTAAYWIDETRTFFDRRTISCIFRKLPS